MMTIKFQHTSVLFTEVIKNLKIKADGIYADGTLGGGGHASGISEKLNQEGILIGIDRDKDAINAAGARLQSYCCKKLLVQSNYVNIKQVLDDLDIRGIDGGVLDLGVSSFQLDNHLRGFSYMQDAPLDMRMNADDPLTAEIVVNEYSQKALTDLIKNYGEERWASRISEFIVKEREKKSIKTTAELVDVIKAAIPASARREGPHPAKRTFQAIRIEINQELSQLEDAIDEWIDVLNPGGRLCVITFHSLEDRIVKDIINRRVNPCTCPKEFPLCICGKEADIKKVTKKPMIAGPEELAMNPRARSAKLRVMEKRG